MEHSSQNPACRGRSRCSSAPRVDYSLHRLRHYTGTAAEHDQNFVLFTNYQFYIDEFVRLGRALMTRPDRTGDGYVAFVEPGNVVPSYR
jgi:AMP nucleosidase